MKQILFEEEYSNLPEDPRALTENSKMAEQPEMELSAFLKAQPYKDWENYTKATGADLEAEYKAEPLAKIKINVAAFEQFMMDNQELCEKKYYEHTYQKGVNELTMNWPMKCGYNHRNTTEYNWGEYGDTQLKLKQLIGGKTVIQEQLGFDYDTASVRLLAYLPGHILPWHFDNMGNWMKKNNNLNPNIETMTCDKGDIKRYFVAITDWHWGHVLQIANSYFPRWKSGEVYNIPKGVYHLSANIGMKIKITASITGVVQNSGSSGLGFFPF